MKTIESTKKKKTTKLPQEIPGYKKAEEEIKNHQKKIELLINSSSDLIFLKDKNFRYLIANKAHEKLFNIKVEDTIGKVDFDFMPKAVAEGCRKSDEEALKSGSISREEWVGEKCFHVVKQRVVDAKGKIIGVAAVIRDITERKWMEEELKQYHFMIESAHDAIFFKDLKSRYIIANNKTLEVFGLPREKIIGKNDYEIMSNREEAKKNIEDDQIVFKTGEPKEITKYMTGADGQEYWFQAIKVPQFDNNGNIIGLVGIDRDITELRRAKVTIKQLRELDKLKDEFLNIAAHELKTPLTSITGLSDVIKDQKSSLLPQHRKYIDIIHQEGTKLSHIIQRILTVTRYESGRETVYIEPFNLTAFVSSLLLNLNILAKKKKSRIITNIEKKNIVIRSDKEKISQVIYNFVDNAVKYGPKSQSIVISVTKPEKDWVKIEVTDQGPGIPPTLRKRLFTKFSQLEPSLTRSQEGTGLGLYICKLIVDMLGGEIGVKSVLSKGSTFYFTLPIKKTSKSPPVKTRPTPF